MYLNFKNTHKIWKELCKYLRRSRNNNNLKFILHFKKYYIGKKKILISVKLVEIIYMLCTTTVAYIFSLLNTIKLTDSIKLNN